MNTSSSSLVPTEVTIDDALLRVRFHDGTETTTSIERFPRLLHATPKQRRVWEVIGKGDGIHWPEIDEDISVRTLLGHAERRLPASSTNFEEMLRLIGGLYETTRKLRELSGGRSFTPDGHLVAEIGKVVAEYVYGLIPELANEPHVDARTRSGVTVQIMLAGPTSTRFGVRWSNRSPRPFADVMLCLKLTSNGFKEIYNGPFPVELLQEKPDQPTRQLQLSCRRLLDLNPALLEKEHSFASVNQWLSSKLQDVA